MAKSQGWNGGRFLLVLVACFVVHFVTNIANDYFDYVQGTDSGNAIGGSRVIQQDKITLTQLGWAIILLYFIGFIISLYIVFGLKLYGLAPLILFAFFSSLFYVAPPIRYGYHGLERASRCHQHGAHHGGGYLLRLLPANRVWMSFLFQCL